MAIHFICMDFYRWYWIHILTKYLDAGKVFCRLKTEDSKLQWDSKSMYLYVPWRYIDRWSPSFTKNFTFIQEIIWFGRLEKVILIRRNYVADNYWLVINNSVIATVLFPFELKNDVLTLFWICVGLVSKDYIIMLKHSNNHWHFLELKYITLKPRIIAFIFVMHYSKNYTLSFNSETSMYKNQTPLLDCWETKLVFSHCCDLSD